jgi:hypothetical protein
MDSGKATFTRRITLLTDSGRQNLVSNPKIAVSQSSPCTVAVSYGPVEHLFQFPYPVDGQGPTIRVSRKAGWLEIHVLLSDPKDKAGGYSRLPMPLTREVDSGLPYSWNLPTVNVNRLQSIEFPAAIKRNSEWIDDHLIHLISDTEQPELLRPSLRLEYKIFIANMCRTYCGFEGPRQRAFGVSVDGDTKLLFFITGLYLDSAWHSVVMDAYCLDVTPEFIAAGDKLPGHQKWDVNDNCDSCDKLLDMWRSSIPAMIERCRDWEHKDTCEYKRNGPLSQRLICSCGLGKVQPDFMKVSEWAEFAPKVVRFALSPLVAEPFIEQTRRQILNKFQDTLQDLETIVQGLRDCSVCGSTGKTKKCGKCEKRYYCGRECQQKDWKRHKPECH